MPRGFVPIDGILSELGNAWEWLSSIGLDPRGTRLEAVAAQIRQQAPALGTDLDAERLAELCNDGALYSALLDARGYSNICGAFRRLKSHELPRRRLSEMLQGPADLDREVAGTATDSGRNALAEMELAADFLDAGLRILGFDDLCFGFGGSTFWVEVKRLGSPRRVQANMDRACAQLRTRMKTDRDRGVIALDAAKAAGFNSGVFTIKTPSAFSKLGDRLLVEFIKRLGEPWKHCVDPRVLGVLLVFKVLLISECPRLVGSARLSPLAMLASASSLEASERARMELLFAQLNQLPLR